MVRGFCPWQGVQAGRVTLLLVWHPTQERSEFAPCIACDKGTMPPFSEPSTVWQVLQDFKVLWWHAVQEGNAFSCNPWLNKTGCMAGAGCFSPWAPSCWAGCGICNSRTTGWFTSNVGTLAGREYPFHTASSWHPAQVMGPEGFPLAWVAAWQPKQLMWAATRKLGCFSLGVATWQLAHDW